MHMHIRIHMVKVISLSEEAYRELKIIKGEKESFSDVVMKLKRNRVKRPISDFFGVFKDNRDEWEGIKKKLEEDRKKFKLRDVQF